MRVSFLECLADPNANLYRIIRLAKIAENGILRPVATCIVSYLDTEGIRHGVEVEAESLYEAAVLAMCRFKEHDCEPGLISNLEVEIRNAITHTVTPRKVREWVNGGARNPKEAITKDRLRAMLLGEPRRS